MKGYRETDVVSNAWNVGDDRSRIKFLAKNPPVPSQMLHDTSLVPSNHPDYFCERIIHTSRFFSMLELSAIQVQHEK